MAIPDIESLGSSALTEFEKRAGFNGKIHSLHAITPPTLTFKKLIAAVAALGVAAISGRASEAETPQPGGTTNPFALKFSGLPFQPVQCGNEKQRTIDEKTAREIIERVFREEGFHLASSKLVQREGLSFVADGYDPKAKAGYFYATSCNLERDAWPKWEESIDSTLIRMDLYGRDARWRAYAKIIRSLPSLREKREVLNGFAEKTWLSLEEAKKLEVLAAKGQEFIAVISQFDRRFLAGGDASESDREACEKMLKMKDFVQQQKVAEELRCQMANRALERFEKRVREYLTWARSRGL